MCALIFLSISSIYLMPLNFHLKCKDLPLLTFPSFPFYMSPLKFQYSSFLNTKFFVSTLESRINVPLRLLIFGIFSRDYGLFTNQILLHKFAHYKGLCLFFLSNFPEATFFQGATPILDFK